MFHAFFFLVLAFSVGAYVGDSYASRAISAVKAEIAKIEAEAMTDAKAVVARIKALV